VENFAKVHDDSSNPSPQPDAAVTSLAQPMATPSQLQPGQIVENHYKVLSIIASGGFGSVYKVRDILLKKTFALKTLHPVVASETTMLRLRKEAQAASMLDHPNLVRAINFGMIDHCQPFLVMEFVEGPTLAQHLKQHARIPWQSALQIFIPVCFAMAYAHDQGVIHRDIKPSNIILAGDVSASNFIPKVVDFGIAKLQFGDESEALSLTKTGEIFGTPLYMSPEQCAGTGVDSRSDIYALGCVLFEALTGAPPFKGNTQLETMMQHTTGKAPSLKEASLGLEFPEALEKLVTRMLAKDSRDRYQSFMDVANDLLLLQKGDLNQMRVIAVPARSVSAEKMKVPELWLYVCLGVIFGGSLVYVLEEMRIPKTMPETQLRQNKQPDEGKTGTLPLPAAEDIDQSQANSNDPETITKLAEIYKQAHEYAQEEAARKRVLALTQKESGPNQQADVVNALNALADYYQRHHKWAEEETARKRTLAIDCKVLDANHPDVVKSLNKLADCYEHEGKYTDAELLFKQALSITEKAVGRDHQDVATFLICIADCYRHQSKYAEAVPLYKRALAIREKAFGLEHQKVADCLIPLADCYTHDNNSGKAESLFKRALTITENVSGKDHADVAGCLNYLAACYTRRGNYEEAEALYQRALTIRERAFGRDNPDDAVYLLCLAECYTHGGKYAEAEALYQRALAIRKKAVGPNDPTVVDCLIPMANCLYGDHRKYSEAEPLYRQALAIKEKTGGRNSKEAAFCLVCIADCCTFQRRYAEAEPLYKRALAINEKALGPNSHAVAEILNGLASCFAKQGRLTEAIQLRQRILLIQSKTDQKYGHIKTAAGRAR